MARRREPIGRWERLLFKVFGPAHVEGAMTGSSQEARDAWKKFQESTRRAKEDEKRKRTA